MFTVTNVAAYNSHNYDYYDSSLDSRPSAYTAASLQQSMGYNSYCATNADASVAHENIKTDSVFFVNSHGFYLNDQNKGGGVLFGDSTNLIAVQNYSFWYGSNPKYLSSLANGELGDVLLAVYLACYSAYTNPYNDNLLDQTVAKGADVAIGFMNEINSAKAKSWSEHFWTRLNNYESIVDALSNARNDCYFEFPYGYWGIQDHYLLVESAGYSNKHLKPAASGTI